MTMPTGTPEGEIDKDQRIAELEAEVERLTRILNRPLYESFTKAVQAEAAHQGWIYPPEHDAGKTPQDWYDTLCHLAGKAGDVHHTGDRKKALHHTISSAALLLHWHQAIRNQLPKPDRKPAQESNQSNRGGRESRPSTSP